MALKVELETWQSGVLKFELRKWSESLEIFRSMTSTARIHFNIAMVYVNTDKIENAKYFQIKSLNQAIECDAFFAVAYFQRGACLFSQDHIEEALKDFDQTDRLLQDNSVIDYTHLGLEFKLVSFEIFFNRGLCFATLGDALNSSKSFEDAIKKRPTNLQDKYKVLDEALRIEPEVAAVKLNAFMVPRNRCFKPPESKIKNSAKKDYLGKPTVIVAIDVNDSYAVLIEFNQKNSKKTPLDEFDTSQQNALNMSSFDQILDFYDPPTKNDESLKIVTKIGSPPKIPLPTIGGPPNIPLPELPSRKSSSSFTRDEDMSKIPEKRLSINLFKEENTPKIPGRKSSRNLLKNEDTPKIPGRKSSRNLTKDEDTSKITGKKSATFLLNEDTLTSNLTRKSSRALLIDENAMKNKPIPLGIITRKLSRSLTREDIQGELTRKSSRSITRDDDRGRSKNTTFRNINALERNMKKVDSPNGFADILGLKTLLR
ncbi:hypothetical protein HK096_001939, partial [Nowakowskiella sp. JEL0078]